MGQIVRRPVPRDNSNGRSRTIAGREVGTAPDRSNSVFDWSHARVPFTITSWRFGSVWVEFVFLCRLGLLRGFQPERGQRPRPIDRLSLSSSSLLSSAPFWTMKLRSRFAARLRHDTRALATRSPRSPSAGSIPSITMNGAHAFPPAEKLLPSN